MSPLIMIEITDEELVQLTNTKEEYGISSQILLFIKEVVMSHSIPFIEVNKSIFIDLLESKTLHIYYCGIHSTKLLTALDRVGIKDVKVTNYALVLSDRGKKYLINVFSQRDTNSFFQDLDTILRSKGVQ